MYKIKNDIHTFYSKNTNLFIEIEEVDEKTKNMLINEITSFIKNCSYKIIFKNLNFNIILFDNIINEILIIRIKKVCKRIEFLYKYFNIRNAINIWFLPIEINRFLPKKGEEVSEKHINGGFTYANGNNVFIYRLEEFPKVMLHEFIHHTSIDTSNKWSNNQIAFLKNELNIAKNSEFLPNESIVEVWATIFQLLFISEELNITFNKLYENELNWALTQSEKLLIHKDTLCNLKECEWKEKTNSYSYIYIKTILLYNINKLLEIGSNIDEIIKIIINTINNNNFLEKILKNKKYVKNNKNTLRMTLYGDI